MLTVKGIGVASRDVAFAGAAGVELKDDDMIAAQFRVFEVGSLLRFEIGNDKLTYAVFHYTSPPSEHCDTGKNSWYRMLLVILSNQSLDLLCMDRDATLSERIETIIETAKTSS